MAEIINVELEQEVELQTSYELSGGIIPTGTININTNGIHDVSSYADANVNVQGGITPTGTKEVTIDAAGTITEDISSYANVEITVPQGEYKPVMSTTITPSISVSNTGLITASNLTQVMQDWTQATLTEGYITSSDVSAKATATGGSATQQLNTVNGQTVTPTTSTQYIAVQGDYVLGAINVAPIPSQYIIPTGTKQITANGTGIDVSEYASVDVNVSGGVEAPTYWRHISISDTGWVYSVENNHVKFTRTAFNNGKSAPLTGAKNNIITNLNTPKMFTINSGDTVRVLFYNVVNPDGIEWNANAKQADSTTSLSYGIGDVTHTNGEDVTFTASATKNVGCWFAYFANNVLGTIEFDFKIFVNGEWVC